VMHLLEEGIVVICFRFFLSLCLTLILGTFDDYVSELLGPKATVLLKVFFPNIYLGYAHLNSLYPENALVCLVLFLSAILT
jgi:hypothetical protein